MKNFALGLSVFLSLGLWIVGCGDSGSSGGCPSGQVACDGNCVDEILPTLTSIQNEVFRSSCAASTCHDADLPAQNLDLSSVAASETGLVDVDAEQVDGKRVAPSDSANSYLMNKILGQNIPPTYLQMPIGGMLCTPKIEAIRQWIDDGAPVN